MPPFFFGVKKTIPVIFHKSHESCKWFPPKSHRFFEVFQNTKYGDPPLRQWWPAILREGGSWPVGTGGFRLEDLGQKALQIEASEAKRGLCLFDVVTLSEPFPWVFLAFVCTLNRSQLKEVKKLCCVTSDLMLQVCSWTGRILHAAGR